MRDYLDKYPIDIYGREFYEKELDNRIKVGFQIIAFKMAF